MSEFWVGNPYKRPNSPYWHIVYEDAAGMQRRKSTKTKDLRIARDMLAGHQREVEQQKVGIVDRYAEFRTAKIRVLLRDYERHLKANNAVPAYVKGTIRQIREFLSFAKVTTIPSIAIADAHRFVADLREKVSARTRDHYAASLRAFGRWLERTGRWDVDPFKGLPVRTANRDKHRVFKRVAFRFEEVEKLVEGAWARFEAEWSLGGMPTQYEYQDGDLVRDRQVLYWFAVTTGFRASECASVRWEDLRLEGEQRSVRLAGEFTKNGDDALVPLQQFVSEALAVMRVRRSTTQVRRGLSPVLETDLVFHVPSKIAEIVRKDAAFAGLMPQRGVTSRRVDFHALRKSCARILIELKVHPKIIQQTMRHADIRLTMDLYGELGQDDLFRELPGTFPVPRTFPGSHGAGGESPSKTVNSPAPHQSGIANEVTASHERAASSR